MYMAKKIAIVVSTYPPYRGGMGNAAARQATLFADFGHDVTVYAPSVAGRVDGVVKIKPLPIWFRFGNAAFVPAVRQAVKDADVVVFHYPFFGAVEALSSLTLLPRQKLVVYYHHDPLGTGGWKRLIFWLHEKIFLGSLLRRASRVVVSSISYAEHSHLTPFLPYLQKNLRAIPFFVDTTRFAPRERTPSLLLTHGLSTETPIVLFVGSLDSAHYFKGVPILLKAWQVVVAKCPEAKLLLVGDGDCRAGYEAEAITLEIKDSVVFVGSATDELLPYYYNLASVCVFPSTDSTEAFGLVALEAMASGKPVVASNLPGVASLVRNHETGLLVEPRNQEVLAGALLSFLQDQLRAASLGVRARQIAEQDYSDAAVRERWRQLIEQL